MEGIIVAARSRRLAHGHGMHARTERKKCKWYAIYLEARDVLAEAAQLVVLRRRRDGDLALGRAPRAATGGDGIAVGGEVEGSGGGGGGAPADDLLWVAEGAASPLGEAVVAGDELAAAVLLRRRR